LLEVAADTLTAGKVGPGFFGVWLGPHMRLQRRGTNLNAVHFPKGTQSSPVCRSLAVALML
jgi:hypothetical protein